MLLLKQKDLLKQVARESAKMSWPGQMHPILCARTKDAVETYFSDRFISHLCKIWSTPSSMKKGYDNWHRQRVNNIGNFLKQGKHVRNSRRNNGPTNYNPEAVACKLLNTFMHQLMKYDKCRYLWKDLHLVFDQGVFKNLHRLTNCYNSLKCIDYILQKNAYKITYKDYMTVQNQLWKFIEELNKRQGAEYQISSRIELNPVLWNNKFSEDDC